mmetsp:Transcript_20935/g.31598  ORF Transcript_20935/g.31598 Transcript_20935/m.31598 type:complete len:617 (+) Transcript_20935:536-2386(+)|eukprot:scaffold19485_cov155-Skeletonema_dohrnii-CCMP3373.AAC.9
MRRLQQTITSSSFPLKRRSLCPPTVHFAHWTTAGLSEMHQQLGPHLSPHRSSPPPYLRYSSSSAAPLKSRLPRDFLSILQSNHPNLKISLNKYELDSHGRGESHHPVSPPDAVLYPSSVEEIQDILRLCCREVYREGDGDVPTVEIVSVIPYGAGTSLEGHLSFLLPQDDSVVSNNDIVEIPSSLFESNSGDSQLRENEKKRVRIKRKGGISIDMSNFQSIGELTPGDGFIKVGAGVTRNSLNDALRHTGMQFMIDPGADATLGGMTACGASGTAAVKYQTMRENVLGLTVVLPPQTIASASNDAGSGSNKPRAVTCGSNALKNSAGYNLPGLFVGSEGTLGVITDVTVKIYPVPSHVIAGSCTFDDLHTAAEAVTTIRMIGIPVSRIELLDEMSIRAFNQSVKNEELKPMDEKATLFFEFAGHSESSVIADLSAARAVCVDDFEGSNFVSATDETTRKKVWAARHRLYYSSIALRGGGDDDGNGATSQSTIVTDVCVPFSSFADIVSATAKDLRDMGVFGTVFGHCGDGNFHAIFSLRSDDTEEYKDKVFKVIELMTERAISVGGSVTGEHGVGYGKKKFLEKMYGAAGVSLMQTIKTSIDPWCIMNPGKIVDVD